jgi:hypothetical protein
MEDDKIESELKGNTLRVYWTILKSQEGTIGVRELQRELKFSSPALAAYHLTKLEELGLVEKTNGEYHLKKEIRIGTLKQFTKLGSFMMPRYSFYAALLTTLLVFYLTQFREINFYSVFGLVLGVLSTCILWYETLRVWRQKP